MMNEPTKGKPPSNAWSWVLITVALGICGMIAFAWLRFNLAAASIRGFDSGPARLAEQLGYAATRNGAVSISDDQLANVQCYGIKDISQRISVSNFSASTVVREYLPAFKGKDDTYYCCLNGRFTSPPRYESVQLGNRLPISLEILSRKDNLYFVAWPASKELTKMATFDANTRSYRAAYFEAVTPAQSDADWVYFDHRPIFEIDRYVGDHWKCSYAIFATSQSGVVGLHGHRNGQQAFQEAVTLIRLPSGGAKR